MIPPALPLRLQPVEAIERFLGERSPASKQFAQSAFVLVATPYRFVLVEAVLVMHQWRRSAAEDAPRDEPAKLRTIEDEALARGAHGLELSAKDLAGLFPSDLFLTLVGVTMLFTVARGSGGLQLVTRAAERLCGSTPGLLGPLFFLLAAAVSAAGAGNVPTAAVLAPPAMLAARP